MKINISIDDVSPHPKSSINVVNRCFRLIQEFPDIKFTLFVPIAYWRTTRPDISTSAPMQINFFTDFCESLKGLPCKNFEIAYHGLYHGIPGKSDNDEFQNLSYEEACQKFDTMIKIVEEAGLKQIFKPIFRPPAWRMSPSAIHAAKDKGFEILALSPDDYAMKIYDGAQNNFGKIVYYNCNPPFKSLKSLEINEIVYHACEWDKNFFNDEHAELLVDFLKKQSSLQFCFMEEMT